jgi:murein DD-endopeptidase MepM/ murein hydrolase activator NlpD
LKKVLLPVLAVLLLACSLIRPTAGYAGAQEEIENKLKDIKKQEADLAAKKKAAEQSAADAKVQKGQEQKKLDEIKVQLDEQGKKLNELSIQLNDVTMQLRETGDQLQQAEDRVKSRDQLLKSRVRLIYMSGTVSYLDVLFSATSFSDFLDRYYALKNIIGQDKEILEANKADRDVVVEKQKQVEAQMDQVKTLVAQTEEIRQNLLVQEKQKQVVIASLNKKEQDADDISEDAADQLVALANARSAAEAQKRKLEEEAAKAKGKTVEPAFAYQGGKLAWPVPSSKTISDYYGMRIDPIKKINKLHAGVDIAAPNGSTIVAAEDGVVLSTSWVNGYGNTVVLDHGNGLWTWYGHIRNNGIVVNEGDKVKRGQKIAEVGSTGDSTGYHLHFEVRINSKATDPMPYLK